MNYLSRYNQYAIMGDRLYVYNTMYQNVISFECSDENKVKEFLMETDKLELQDLGFIRNDSYETEKMKLWYNKLKFSQKTLSVMLIMTYSCNCACSYCFEKLDQSLNNHSEQSFRKTIEFLIRHYEQGQFEEMELSFFGGEPLLEVSRIKKTYEMLSNAGINVKSNIITNGVLLNKSIIKELSTIGITNYQITIDGPKELHDIRRPCKNGDSCWEKIQENLGLLVEMRQSVSVRINIDNQNVSSLKDICDALPQEIVERDECCIYVAPIVGCESINAIETLKERTKTVLTAWETIERNNLPIIISPPVYAPCPYHSVDSAFYIDFNGNIYACGGFIGDVKKIDQFGMQYGEAFYERISYEPTSECIECSFFPVCMGGCQFETDALGTNCQVPYLKAVYDEYYTKYAKS